MKGTVTIDAPLETASQQEVFAEVPLFEKDPATTEEHADCGCFDCDGNPCVK